MADFVKFDLPSGGSLWVEESEDRADEYGGPREQPMGFTPGASGVRKAQKSLVDTLQSFVPAADEILTQLKTLAPDQLTVEMNMSFSSEVGIALVKAGGKGHLQVVMTWNSTGSDE